MSHAVLQGVMFNATSIAMKLPMLAQVALEELVSDDEEIDTARHARVFLREVISGRAIDVGQKGDVCLWSTVSNYSSKEDLLQALTPFFKRVCEVMAGSPLYIGHPDAPEILVFGVDEQEYGHINGLACRLNRQGELDIRRIEIDFAFHGGC